MSIATVQMMTVESARERRAQVLADLGCDETSLRARARLYQLDARELAALDELNELDFLLGE